MGTKVVEPWGRDKTGDSLGLDQPPHIFKTMLENAHTAVAIPCGFQLVNEIAVSNGAQMSVEAIALPLKVQAGQPHRLVAYSEVLQTMKYGDLSEHYIDLPVVNWVDIGAGVPEHAPFIVSPWPQTQSGWD